MWPGHLFPVLMGTKAKRHGPESEAKVEITHEGIHVRGNAESRSQVVEPMWDE